MISVVVEAFNNRTQELKNVNLCVPVAIACHLPAISRRLREVTGDGDWVAVCFVR